MRHTPFDARALDEFERRQLDRLADAVLLRPATELNSIARENPALVREWISEIQSRRDEVEAKKAALDTALQRLVRIAERGRAGA